jgi:hypothetical protein
MIPGRLNSIYLLLRKIRHLMGGATHTVKSRIIKGAGNPFDFQGLT